MQEDKLNELLRKELKELNDEEVLTIEGGQRYVGDNEWLAGLQVLADVAGNVYNPYARGVFNSSKINSAF